MFFINQKSKGRLSSAKWRNLVAAFLNNLCGDGFIKVHRPDTPSSANPPRITLDLDELRMAVGISNIPLTLTAKIKSGSLESLWVALPSLTVTFNGENDWTIKTGTEKGTVNTSQKDARGRYLINDLTSGKIYLTAYDVDKKQLYFVDAEPEDAEVEPFFVGTVETSGKVTQYQTALNGDVKIGGGGGGGSSVTFPLTMKAVMNDAGTACTAIKIYLPELEMCIGNDVFSIEQSSSTGAVSAITDSAGWYEINGITSGDIYLVNSNEDDRTVLYFTNQTPTNTDLDVLYIGSVGSEGTIYQNSPSMSGTFGSELQQFATGANETFEPNDGGDSQEILAQGLSLDETTWERGVTKKQRRVDMGTTASPNWQIEDVDDVFYGIKMQVVSRVVRSVDRDYFFWRWAYFDKNGALYKLSKEQGVYAEVNYDAY